MGNPMLIVGGGTMTFCTRASRILVTALAPKWSYSLCTYGMVESMQDRYLLDDRQLLEVLDGPVGPFAAVTEEDQVREQV